jgi:acetyl esterase
MGVLVSKVLPLDLEALRAGKTPGAKFRRRVVARIVDGAYERLARAGEAIPAARPELHGVERIRDVPYRDSGSTAHLLDVYRPIQRSGPLPTVLYIHGGAFRALSKDSHWLMGLIFARRGYLVFNINYRLTPKHPYPAALIDAASAWSWVREHISEWGGDASRVFLAGESAGANLATSLTIASCYKRPEAAAREVWDTELMPKAVLPCCGILQVSDPERFSRRKRLPFFIRDQLVAISEAYLPGEPADHTIELADPLRVLERALPPDRPLPPFFAAVGTKDPLLDDTRRLKSALDALEVPCIAKYYPGEMHAFHALIWRRAARACWREMFDFLTPLSGIRRTPRA